MAYIRSYDTKVRSKGKAKKRYEVCWREPATDASGLPIPGKMRSRQESYATRADAEARRDALNAAKHSIGGAGGLAEQRKAGALTFAHYAAAWLTAKRNAAAAESLKGDTVDGYERRLGVYALPAFGSRAIASITSIECEQFRAELIARGMAPATVKHHWSTFDLVFKYALQHGALAANPCDGVDVKAAKAKVRNKRHHPLTAEQVAAVAAAIGERYPVYELFTLFAAYTGLRAEELAGLEVADLVFTTVPVNATAPTVSAVIHVRRAKKRTGGVWVPDTLKSVKSRRTVPLPNWLAARMHAYLFGTPTTEPVHPRADEPTAPLWPNRALGGARRRGCRAIAPLNFGEPVDPGAYYKNLMRPALEDVGLPATRPAKPATESAPEVAAIKGVRFHDLRHTAATLWLSAGVHFMQVSKWLGHSTYTLTLDVYGDYIPATDGGAANPLPEPTAPAKAEPVTALPSNVVSLFGRKAN